MVSEKSTAHAVYNEDEADADTRDRLMWQGFDPEIKRDLASVKAIVTRRHQTPTKEWPLIFVGDHDALLVVREWPDGEITAYWTSEIRDSLTGDGGSM
jgi:hypothetical protein